MRPNDKSIRSFCIAVVAVTSSLIALVWIAVGIQVSDLRSDCLAVARRHGSPILSAATERLQAFRGAIDLWQQHCHAQQQAYFFGAGVLTLALLSIVWLSLVRARKEKHLEGLLSENEERLGLALDAAQIGTWAWDPVTDRLIASPRTQEIWGCTLNDNRGMLEDLLAGVHPDDIANVRAALHRARETGATVMHDFRIVRPDGSVLWASGRGRCQYDESGTAVRMHGTVLDITHRREQEAQLTEAIERLRSNEARYRQLFDANPEPMWVYDVDTLRFLMVNDAAIWHYGYTRDEFRQMTLADIRPPQDVPRLLDNVAHVTNGTIDAAGVRQHRRKDGTLIDVEITSHVLGFEGRRAELVLAHDVTDRRRAEQEARQAEQRREALVEQAPVGIVIIDLETGLAVEFNQLAHQQLGYTREEFARLRVSDYEALESVDAIKAHTEEILRKGGDAFETQHRMKTGELRNVYVMMRILDFGGRRDLYCIYQDITDRKQAAVALRRANRALKTLSAANEELMHAGTEQQLLEAVCRVIVAEGGYRTAAVGYAEHDAGKTIRPMAWNGMDKDYITSHVQTWADTDLGQRPISRALRSGKTEIARDILAEPAFAGWKDDATRRGYASNVALPLLDDTRIMGVLNIYAGEPDAFDADEIRLLEELAGSLAYGIVTLRTRSERNRIAHEHRHHEEILRKSLEQSIQAIADTVEMRDPYTAGHQRRVSRLATAIAAEMGLEPERIDGLRFAGMLHDLGKISIPAEILAKPKGLSAVERMLVQGHPRAGYEILKDISFPWPIADIILQHHERMDGSGYPSGLKGEALLLEARILAVADTVEAMAGHRPYRPSLGVEAALQQIEKEKGVAYDAAAAEACLRVFREKHFAFG